MNEKKLLLSGILLTCLAAPLAWSAAQHQAASESGKPAGAAQTAALQHALQPFFSHYCLSCHNAKVQSGGLDLVALSAAAPMAAHRDEWRKVLDKLQTGAMPPKDSSVRPDPPAVQRLVRTVTAELERAARQAPKDPGRVTARRLNRSEYNNTLRDLLGVDLRPADDFPQDDSGYGFDNIGDVLSLSPVLLERYLSAADQVTRRAIFGASKLDPTVIRLNAQRRQTAPSQKPLEEYDATGLTLPSAMHTTFRCPADGKYQFRIILTGARPLGSDPLHLALWIDGEKVRDLEYDPEGKPGFFPEKQDLSSKAVECRVPLTTGAHWIQASYLRYYEGLPASYSGPNPSKRPIPPPPDPEKLFPLRPNATPRQLAARKKRLDEASQPTPANGAAINAIEVSGPFEQVPGPSAASTARIFPCGHADGKHLPSCPRKIVADFARRAFRRPVSTDEVSRYLRLYYLARKQGDSFNEGICIALQGILVSPQFLYRIEADPPATSTAASHPINQYELASRLSYFLWSSTPDDELLRCADHGTLRRPEVLAAQVRRLLRDPRSSALTENFAGQWLELRKLESVTPDRRRFPEFDAYLRYSIRRETELFFQDIIQHDRSIQEFIDAKYSFLNGRLAEFYGIPGVQGPEFRKVDLTGTPRGGILTQASVLTVSSYATRTSPVLRGKWILSNLLNTPPPPPPPGVPNLDEKKIAQGASLRQQLEAHRANPTCAACHSRMDPLGFALENFDAVGAWRTKDGDGPVDTTGTLPDGRTFQGPEGLKKILDGDREAFTRCLTEKLLTYALGRGLEYYDEPTVRAISARVATDDYRFSRLVLEIVNSLPFQQRRGGTRK